MGMHPSLSDSPHKGSRLWIAFRVMTSRSNGMRCMYSYIPMEQFHWCIITSPALGYICDHPIFLFVQITFPIIWFPMALIKPRDSFITWCTLMKHPCNTFYVKYHSWLKQGITVKMHDTWIWKNSFIRLVLIGRSDSNENNCFWISTH